MVAYQKAITKSVTELEYSEQYFTNSLVLLGSFHLELVQRAFGDCVRTKALYWRLTVNGNVPVCDQPTSALLFVLNIHAGSSCGRWARC